MSKRVHILSNGRSVEEPCVCDDVDGLLVRKACEKYLVGTARTAPLDLNRTDDWLAPTIGSRLAGHDCVSGVNTAPSGQNHSLSHSNVHSNCNGDRDDRPQKSKSANEIQIIRSIAYGIVRQQCVFIWLGAPLNGDERGDTIPQQSICTDWR